MQVERVRPPACRRLNIDDTALEDHGDLAAADGADAGVVELRDRASNIASPVSMRPKAWDASGSAGLSLEPDSPTMATVSPAPMPNDTVDVRLPRLC
jgi:hypothetical protein